MNGGIDETCAPPTKMLNHESAQRPANCAGKTTEQRQAGNWSARFAAIHAAKRSENSVIESGAHSETNEHPGEQIDRQNIGQTDQREACGIEQRTRQQHWSSA